MSAAAPPEPAGMPQCSKPRRSWIGPHRSRVWAVAAIIAIFAIKMLVDAVASFILTAVPVLVLIVLAYIGFKYFQSRQSA